MPVQKNIHIGTENPSSDGEAFLSWLLAFALPSCLVAAAASLAARNLVRITSVDYNIKVCHFS